MLKKIINIFLILFFSVTIIYADEVKLTSDKYILYNLNENKVLLEKDSHKETQIASLTKIMTVIISIENVKDFNKEVIITKEMLKGLTWDIATIGLKSGDKVTYNDLLYATMLPSAADAVNALALSINGSYENHLMIMNAKAKELELNNTHYSNVIGLYDKDNYSSAYDISKLLLYCLKNKKFKEIFETKTYTMSNGKKIDTTIKKYDSPYIKGSKTGFTTKAGRCIASISSINGVDYLFVTLNNYNKIPTYINETVNTYKYYENNYSYKNIIDENDIIVTLKTKYAKEKNIDIKVDKEYTYYLKNDFNKDDLTYKYTGIGVMSYFTEKGTKIGKLDIIYNDEIIKSIDLLYDGNLRFSLIKYLWINKYVILFIFLIWLIIHKKKRKIKRKISKMLNKV